MRTYHRQPRIVIVRHHPYPGDPHLRRNVFTLRDAGFDVEVICDCEPGRPRYERVDGVTVFRMPVQHKHAHVLSYVVEYLWFTLLATATTLRSLWRRYDFVEIDNMPDWLVLAALVPRALGARVSLYMFENMPELLASDHDLPSDHVFVRALVMIERLCAQVAHTLIAPHEMARRILIGQGIPPEKIVTVPNVPNEQVFLAHVRPSDIGRHMIPRASRSKKSSFRLVTHGSLLERYGIQTLVQSMAILREQIPGIQLEIIGQGEYRPRLEELTRDLKLEDRITFTGTLAHDDIAPRLLEADLGIVPLWTDFVPNKLMEYLALGLPTVVTDSSALRLYFDDAAVYFVPQRDAQALADAILTLYRDPGRCAALAREGNRVFRASLAWQVTANDYLGNYGASRQEGYGKHSSERQEHRRVPRHWIPFVLGESRGLRNAVTRLPTIVSRFGMFPGKAESYLETLVEITERHGTHLTLPVTAVTARRHPEVMRRLAARGVEIAAHGYVHNDYSVLSASEQQHQVRQARDELTALGLPVRGWRCPYSRWNADTLDALQASGFEYDATPVCAWPVYQEEAVVLSREATADYRRLCALYGARDALDSVVLPTMVDKLVQIPMSIPQDEDMVDRLHLDGATMSRVWRRMLHDVHARGEIFVMCLHPERSSMCATPLDDTLAEAGRLADVWIATLGSIADWWRRRSESIITMRSAGEGRWQIDVTGPAELTTTVNGARLTGSGSLVLDAIHKPAIHCGPGWPEKTIERLREGGYSIDREGDGNRCALDLDRVLPRAAAADAVVRHIQQCDTAIARVQPWPSGYRSCLSITGDVDALTLIDFALRLTEF